VREKSIRTLTLTNTGDLDAPFRWKYEKPPFTLTPEAGLLKPGEQVTVTITFFPTEATSLDGFFECRVAGGELIRAVRVLAISKFPYVSLAKPLVDFGELLVGKRLEQKVKLRNQSEVWTTFKMKSLDTDRDPVFLIKPTSGLIPPGEDVDLRLVYCPQSTGTWSSDRFLFQTPGGNHTQLTLTGNATGPQVSTDVHELDFGDLVLGRSKSKQIRVLNESNQPVQYEFDNNQSASFSVDRPSGTIAPLLSVILIVTFKPIHTINYYKRLHILFKNQTPLHLDLYGTAYDELVRPAPLLHAHIARYLRSSFLFPELKRASPMKLTAAGETVNGDHGWLDGDVSHPAQCYKEFFADSNPSNTEQEVTLSSETISFGACSHTRGCPPRSIFVTNHTESKMMLRWDIPILDAEEKAAGLAAKKPLFMVSPEVQDIRPGQTVECTVTFVPTRPGFYYCQKLEAYCFYKTNRNFRLIDSDCFGPPFKLSTIAYGHTFPPQIVHFLPNAKLSVPPKKKRGVEFPGCSVGSSGYLSITLSNSGDTPLCFTFPETSDASGIFTVKPAAGVIKQQSFQILCLKFTPPAPSNNKSSGNFSHVFSCVLNYDASNIIPLKVSGRGYTCDLSFVRGKELYFKPTCQGMLSKRSHPLKNSSRIPLYFKALIPPKFAHCLRVTPSEGEVKGNEQVDIVWQFIPDQIKAYSMTVPVLVSTSADDMSQDAVFKQKLLLYIKGDCTQGVLAFDPPQVTFDTVLIQSHGLEQNFFVKNSSDCALNFQLSVKQTEPELKAFDQLPAIFFDTEKGEVPAGSQKRIKVRFAPSVTGAHSFQVVCRFGDSSVLEDARRGESRTRKRISSARKTDHDWRQEQQYEIVPSTRHANTIAMTVQGHGGFPNMAITDACFENAQNTNRDQLSVWRQLSLDKINRELTSPQSKTEMELNSEGNSDRPQTFKASDTIHDLEQFSFDLGAGALGAPAETVFLRLQNTSQLPVEWLVRFPEDMDVVMDHWADTGDPTNDERWQQAIADHDLFQVEPRDGRLQPGQACVLQISYFHKFVGLHELPVILQVKRGKQMCLHLTGATPATLPPAFTLSYMEAMETEESTAMCYSLEDVPLGLEATDVPIQTFPLINHTNVPLSYRIDTSAIAATTDANFDVAVWQCLEEEGIVQPNATAHFPIVFRPLEAKAYNLPLYIHVPGSSIPQMVVLRATGFIADKSEALVTHTTQAAVDATSFPRVALLSVPGQMAHLSSARVVLGDLPPVARTEAVVTLRNATDVSLNFEWPEPAAEGPVVSILPRQGSVGAGQQIMCRIMLETGSRPILFDRDFSCEVWPTVPRPEPSSTEGLDTYGVEKIIGSERLQTRGSVITSSTISWDVHLIEKEMERGPSVRHGAPPMGETLTERTTRVLGGMEDAALQDSAAYSHSQDNLLSAHDALVALPPSQQYLHIEALRRRTRQTLHLRVLFRVLSLAHLERCARGGQDHPRSRELKTEANVSMRYCLKVANGEGLEPGGTGNLNTEALLQRVLLETVHDSEVTEAFSRLAKPPVPYFDELYTPPSELSGPSSDEGGLVQVAASAAPDGEFARVSSEILRETIFNVMQEAVHGAFDVNTAPRRIVTNGATVLGDEV
jgi:hypothetical protein